MSYNTIYDYDMAQYLLTLNFMKIYKTAENNYWIFKHQSNAFVNKSRQNHVNMEFHLYDYDDALFSIKVYVKLIIIIILGNRRHKIIEI